MESTNGSFLFFREYVFLVGDICWVKTFTTMDVNQSGGFNPFFREYVFFSL